MSSASRRSAYAPMGSSLCGALRPSSSSRLSQSRLFGHRWEPSRAAAPLTVVGGGFTSASEALGMLHCRFNGTVVHAHGERVCSRLQHDGLDSGPSVRGGEHERSRVLPGGVQFELISLLMQDLTPWSGPVLGGTVVTIAGTGLRMPLIHCVADLVRASRPLPHPLTARTACSVPLRRRCLTGGRLFF